MIADNNKTVHAFTSQWVGDEPRQNAIVYRQWSAAGGWTTPVDILLPPSGETKVYGAFLDQAGIVHLLFQAGDAKGSSIYYSSAPVVDAGRATSWSTPEVVGEDALVPGSGSITGDANGNLVVIYNGNFGGNGVYSAHSSNGGQSWSEAELVFLTYETDLIPFSLQLTQGQDGRTQAVWNLVDSEGVDKSVYYTQMTFNDNQWSTPVLLEERVERADFFGPSFPAVVDNGKEIVVMYNSGNPDNDGEVAAGRPVQRVRKSNDGGKTWSETISPFPRHVGRSGSHAMVLDSSGVAHTLFIQRIEPRTGEKYAPIAGLWHSALLNGSWTEPELIDLGNLSGHDVRAVVSQGNNLLVVFREDPGAALDGVWYVSALLDTSELPVSTPVIPSPTPTIALTPTLNATAMTPTPSLIVTGTDIPRSAANNPGRPILLGLLPVIGLVLGTAITLRLYRYRG